MEYPDDTDTSKRMPGCITLANSLEDEGDYQGAITAYTLAIHLSPHEPGLYHSRALCYVKVEEDEKALEDYSQAISLSPFDNLHYVSRAFLYCERGQYDLAANDVTRSIALNPDYGAAYYLRAKLDLLVGDADRAVEGYEKAIELDYDAHSASVGRLAAYKAGRRWWIFSRKGRCVGNIVTRGRMAPSAQVGSYHDNPHFSKMVAAISPLAKQRSDHSHSVIFLGIELDKVIDAMTDSGYVLSTDPTWNPWGWTPWSNESWDRS